MGFSWASLAGVAEVFIALFFAHELKGTSRLEHQMSIGAELAWNLILIGLNWSVLRDHDVAVADLIEACDCPAQPQIEFAVHVWLCLRSRGNQDLRDGLTCHVTLQVIEATITFLNQHPQVMLNPTMESSFRYTGDLAQGADSSSNSQVSEKLEDVFLGRARSNWPTCIQ